MKYVIKQKISHDNLLFVNQIVDSVKDYQKIEIPSENVAENQFFINLFNCLKGFYDLAILLFKIKNNSKSTIYFIHDSFLYFHDKEYKINFYKNAELVSDKIFISYSKYKYVAKVEGVKVYNFGIIVNLLSKINLFCKQTKLNNFNEWLFVNDLFTSFLRGNSVFIPSYSNEVGLSLCLSKNRNKFFLIEVQHGNVINYQPYSFVANLKLIDKFWYKNLNDKRYLEQNLYKNQNIIYQKLKTVNVEFGSNSTKFEILYISSYEFDGFHPVFLKFIEQKPKDLVVRLRLHPRQKNLQPNFITILENNGISYLIHDNTNWYDQLPSNIIVISPLSSVIEEAVYLNLKTIIIDKLGKDRYDYLLVEKKCFYSNDLLVFFDLK
jgi:hypothetical protein